jgi:hypothetical protein
MYALLGAFFESLLYDSCNRLICGLGQMFLLVGANIANIISEQQKWHVFFHFPNDLSVFMDFRWQNRRKTVDFMDRWAGYKEGAHYI